MSSVNIDLINISLINNSIQPGILSYILILLGVVGGISKQIDIFVNNNLQIELKKWIKRINIKTKFEDIGRDQIKYLIQFFYKRIGDRPDQNLIQSVDLNFDRSLFYSKKIFFEGGENFTVDEDIELSEALLDESDFANIGIEKLESWVRKCIDFKEIREGDVVSFTEESKSYRNDGIVIYNGKNIEYLDYTHNDYGHVVKTICINDYPVIDYFANTIDHNNLVWLRGTKEKLKLLKIIVLDKSTIFKYITSDNYIIYTYNKNFENIYLEKDCLILEFDSDKFCNRVYRKTHCEFGNEINLTLKTNQLILFDSVDNSNKIELLDSDN
jgi:hypothetical protein